jgi:hypothetical protein
VRAMTHTSEVKRSDEERNARMRPRCKCKCKYTTKYRSRFNFKEREPIADREKTERGARRPRIAFAHQNEAMMNYELGAVSLLHSSNTKLLEEVRAR